MISNYELVGQKFNRLTVLTQDGVHRNRQKLWLCKCDCGNFSKVTTNALVKNRTKSCGCLRLERLRNAAKHLKTGTVIYRRWCAMKSRCNTSSTSSFEIYGGRGGILRTRVGGLH